MEYRGLSYFLFFLKTIFLYERNFRDDPNLIVVSTPRCLRLADVRERNGFQTTVSVQSAQLGVCTEPNMGYRIACHSRNTVFVFDRRFISLPIHEVLLDVRSFLY